METIKGAVKRVIFHNEESGFKVMKVRIPSGPIITLTGEFGPEIISGTVADFHGDYKTHSKYGTNFRVSSYNISHNVQEMASIRLFIDAISPNIGPERAQSIVNYFGNDTIDILDNEPYRLQEVEGIGKISAKSLAESWKENREKWQHERQEYTLRAFLNSLGIKERKVKKIIRYFGGGLKAEETIRENPYRLTEIEGFGFTTADYVAKQLGMLESDPLRLKAFIYYAINILCPRNGHLYLTVGNCVELINRHSLETNTYFLGKRIIIDDDTADPIKNLIDDELILLDRGCLYSVKNFKSETESARKIVSILNEESDLILLTRESVDEHITNFERENQITLSDEQRGALYYFVEKKVYAITGCPGTGKTTVLKAIVDLIRRLKLDLTCMTPTGISAKKMASTIDYHAYTIHRRLGFRGDQWLFGELNKYETDVVIIDETSMVDQEVFYRLLCALKKRVHLIFVGDNNQLPSVGAGNVLKELITCGEIPVVNLEKIFRQDEASDIIKAAHKIKNGETDLSLFKAEPTADCFFIREIETDIIENFVIRLAQKFKDERRQFQIITPRNDGPLSVNILNNSLQAILNPGPEPECSLGKFVVRRGDRVIIIKNDYELGVFNGEVGKVINIDSSKIVIQLGEFKFVDISKEIALERLKLAYALSVHRCIAEDTFINTSQGLKKISKIKKGDRVQITSEEQQEVLWCGKTEEKELIRIKTKRGYTIESSKDHRFLIADNEGELLEKAKNIKIGKYACINRDKVEGNEIKLLNNSIRGKGITPRITLTLPDYLNADISWLFGFLIGDGSYRDIRDGTVEVSKPENLELLNEFDRITSSIGLNSCPHEKNNKPHSKYVCSKNFRDWLYSVGFNYVTAKDKDIPDIIFETNIENRFFFIAGLIDSDGSVNKNNLIRYTTVSEKIVLKLQLLLLSCGIVSSININKSKKETENDRFCLTISVDKSYLFKKYLRNIKKRNRIKVDKNHKTFNKNIPYGKKYILQFFDFFDSKKTQGKKGLGLYSKYKNLYRALRRILYDKHSLTYDNLGKMIDVLKKENKPIPMEFTEVLKKYTLFDEIVSVEKSAKKMTRDMEVQNKHLYIANGFICHNSQGQEYEHIILPFVNQFGRNMLQRNLLYTAITRAQKKVIIIGHGSALEKAINNSSVQRRNTNLGERIQKCLQERKKNSLPTQHGELVSYLPAQYREEPPLSEAGN